MDHHLGRIVAAASVSLVVIFASVGCSSSDADKAAEAAVERSLDDAGGGSVDIDSDAGAVQLETGDGSVSAGVDETPEGWPEDVPVLDDLTITYGSTSGDEGSGREATIMAETDRMAADVVADYEDAFADWEETERTDMSGPGTTTLAVGWERDGRRIALAVLGGEGATQVTITHVAPGAEG